LTVCPFGVSFCLIKSTFFQDVSEDSRKFGGSGDENQGSVSGVRSSVERGHFRSSFPASMSSLAIRQNNGGNISPNNVGSDPPNLQTNRWGRQKSSEISMKNGNSKSNLVFFLP